jgi:hypothetical protein
MYLVRAKTVLNSFEKPRNFTRLGRYGAYFALIKETRKSRYLSEQKGKVAFVAPISCISIHLTMQKAFSQCRKATKHLPNKISIHML